MNTSKLKRASANDANPTPGYLYKEIADMTQISYEVSESVCDFLFKRLEHNSPHVKVKILKIIKNTAVMGHPDFKKLASRRSEDINKCSKFVGRSDPLHGDAFNAAVRAAANEAFIAVFSTSSSNNQRTKMQGFSNPNYEPTERDEPSKGEAIWNKVSEIIPTGRKSKKEQHQHFTHGAGGFEMFERRRQAQKTGAGNTPEEPTLPNSNISVPGGFQMGGFNDQSTFVPPSIPDDTQDVTSSPPRSQQHKNTSTSLNTKQTQPSHFEHKRQDSSSDSHSDFNSVSHEERFVNEKTSPSGSHSVPSRSLVSSFCQRARNMDLSEIAELLDEKLLSPKWQTRLKSLYFVEGLIQQNHDQVKSYFIDNTENLCQLSNSSRLTAAKKAKSILKQIGKEDLIGASSSPRPSRKNQNSSSQKTEKIQSDQTNNNSSLIDFENSDDPSQIFAGLDITEGQKPKSNSKTKTNNFDPQNFWGGNDSTSSGKEHKSNSPQDSQLFDDLDITQNNSEEQSNSQQKRKQNKNPSSNNEESEDIFSFFESAHTHPSSTIPITEQPNSISQVNNNNNHAAGTSMRSKMSNSNPNLNTNMMDAALYQYPPQMNPQAAAMPTMGYPQPPYPPTGVQYPQQYPYPNNYAMRGNVPVPGPSPTPANAGHPVAGNNTHRASSGHSTGSKKTKGSEFSFLDDGSDGSDQENGADNVLSEMLEQEFSRNRRK